MAKTFNCKRCGTYLGEMEKGKFHKNAVSLCEKCIDFYEQCDSLMQLNVNKGRGKAGENPLGGFGDLFDGDFFKTKGKK